MCHPMRADKGARLISIDARVRYFRRALRVLGGNGCLVGFVQVGFFKVDFGEKFVWVRAWR